MYELMRVSLFDDNGELTTEVSRATKADITVQLGGFRQKYGPADITVVDGCISLALDGEWTVTNEGE